MLRTGHVRSRSRPSAAPDTDRLGPASLRLWTKKAILKPLDASGHCRAIRPARMMEKFVIVSMPYRRLAAIAVLSAGVLAPPCASLCADFVARSVARLDLRQLSRRAPRLDPARRRPRPPPITAPRSRADPKNSELLDRAFVSVLADGDIEEAGRLAERVLVVNKTDRIARLVAGVRALKQKQYAAASTASSRNRCADRSPT